MKENLQIIACLCALAAVSAVAALMLLCVVCAPFAIIGYTIYKCISLFR